MKNVLDRDIQLSVWNQYLKKYDDHYLLRRDEIGICSIHLKQKLGFIHPYSIVHKQLVAVLTFRSKNHMTFFKKRLVTYKDLGLRIMQEGDFELCILFFEKDIKLVENLFKIRKKYKLTEKERKIRSERLRKARAVKVGRI
jgi:hypothetical protein